MPVTYLAGARIVRASMDSAANVLIDEQALDARVIFPVWSEDSVYYNVNDRVQ